MVSIFISYRRDDSAGEAGRLRDHLAARFGQDQLFMDIEAIAPGLDFTQAIERALAQCQVFVVIIGRRWLDPAGRRRLADPADFVHIEVAAGLKRDIPVIPVLVQGAHMPAAADLPPPLASLATRQAVTIDHEEFGADTGRLIRAIEKLLGLEGRTRRRAPLALAGLGVAVLALGGGFGIVRYGCRDAGRESAPPAGVDPAVAARIDEALAISAQQRARRQYAEAWRTLEEAGPLLQTNERAQTSREDLALEWLQKIRVGEGERFGDIVAKLEGTLDRGSLSGTPERRADLLAHLGWASFLRWRDGDQSQDPERTYRQALGLDADNVYAHVMLGHWLLWRRPIDLAGAREHFAAAVASGRDAEFARSLQIAALINANDPAANLEILRTADEMRRRGEAMPEELVYQVWQIYVYALSPLSGDDAEGVMAGIFTVLPPAEHLATFRWLFGGAEFLERYDGLERDYVLGILAEACGEREAALESLRAVAAELKVREITSGAAFERTNAALARLEPAR